MTMMENYITLRKAVEQKLLSEEDCAYAVYLLTIFNIPDLECRKQLFEIELLKRPHEEKICIDELARLTEGYTSSDISYMVKETARNAFEACLMTGDKPVVKISEKMLKEIIAGTRPSVTRDDMRRYEKMRDDYIKHSKNERPRIGFIT